MHVYQRCTAKTKNTNGRCRFHLVDGEATLWDLDPHAVNPILEREHAELQAQIETDRSARERKWKRVAARINYTATDRQIYYLLDLGVDPADLKRIDKEEASQMIDRLVGWEWRYD